MAADGGWVRGGDRLEPAAQLRRLLHDLETRAAGLDGPTSSPSTPPLSAPLSAQTLRALIEALQAVSQQAARQAAHQADGRNAALVSAIAALSARLDALDSGLADSQVEILQRFDRLAPDSDPDPNPDAALTPDFSPAREPWIVRATLIASTALAGVAAAAALVATLMGGGVGSRADIPGRIEPLRPMLPTAEKAGASDPGKASLIPAPTRPASAPSQAPQGDDYARVAESLRRGETTAIARLTGLAERGDPRARLHLAGLYESGGQGLPRDLAAARMWTRRAAGDGDRVAMHNLGLFLMEGQGGPRDDVEAVAWFRRAADRGVVDSQFNLAVLYEAGRGVPANLREAYRWFSVAANAGDASARERQVQLEARLTPAERASLDRDVRAFAPGARPASTGDIIIPPATTVAESQAFLARRGYYLGPLDGETSPGYATAVSAYLADHPAALSTPSSPATISR